jgi:hypothetical protein
VSFPLRVPLTKKYRNGAAKKEEGVKLLKSSAVQKTEN